jgi:hypothetical protein
VCRLLHPRIHDEVSERTDIASERGAQRGSPSCQEDGRGVAVVLELNRSQLARHGHQAEVRADGSFATCHVAVESDQDTAVGQGDGPGKSGYLIRGERCSARGHAGVLTGGGDADRDRVEKAFDQDGLGTALKRGPSFGEAGQDAALGEDLGVWRVEVPSDRGRRRRRGGGGR